ncbi:sulfiredoxin, chloroplastic/mitochondrial [Phalaenopsis equestris]|uniref:sulfiredoxin, chloroplastic/mitochondrial n=1 Tax=Phalaenopsis equestris TaxID=78828 RepID=UPI0009E40EB2|nr:sulfiredoxin, chloroplastic/mitochondrial [Phalaenopsis equestris]
MSNLQLNLTQTVGAFSARKIRASSNGIPFSKPKSGLLILDLPLEKIRRPLMRTRENDQEKVKDLMESIREIGLQEPIDVLEVEGVYYGFSGCHRFEAHQRLGLSTIRCKIRRGTKETLRHHMR